MLGDLAAVEGSDAGYIAVSIEGVDLLAVQDFGVPRSHTDESADRARFP